MKISKFMKIFEFFYPKSLAEDWDNIGLLLGNPNHEIKRALTCLEITNEVVDEAIEKNIDLIIAHHPIIFNKISALTSVDATNRKIIKLIQNNIAVYAAHTNVDIAANGMNDWLSEIIGIKVLGPLSVGKKIQLKKVAIETNQEDLFTVMDVIKNVGGGQKNRVKSKALITPKVSYVEKLANSKENQETQNVLEIETFMYEEQIFHLKKQLYKLKANENIYTNYQIYNVENLSQVFGIGKVGTIKPTSLETLALKIKDIFAVDHVKIGGSREKIIKKVAIVGGEGSEFINDAIANGCDVLITGDTKYHQVHYAVENGLCIIDAGHNIEIVFNDIMADFLEVISDFEVIASEVDSNPYEVII